ncbi:MAG: AAA family ATPase [Alphaproteobacteria bacterium]
MLIEFSVANYRSIKDKQTLSMVANKGRRNKNVSTPFKTGFKAAEKLLPVAAIYGPNGSGKSNIIKAMDFVKDFVKDSAKDKSRNDKIEIDPFLFVEEKPLPPCEFEIVFIQAGYLFEYGFTASKDLVQAEWLYATPLKNQTKTRQIRQEWFVRKLVDGKLDITVNEELDGEKEVWKKSTRSNALFLSTAISLNAEVLVPIYDWIDQSLKIIPPNTNISRSFTLQQIQESGQKDRILTFMQSLDFSFNDILISEREINEADFADAPAALKEFLLEEIIKKKDTKIIEALSQYTVTSGSKFTLDFEEESEGTQRLFAMAGPLLSVLDHGYVLVIDEMEKSLHPHAMQAIISMFHNPNINKKNAQLIFTTHNTTVMNLLDRDQIWLLEKTRNLETVLTNLAEHQGNAKDIIEKHYLDGRYGALPILDDLERLFVDG